MDPNAAAGSGTGETPTASQGVFKAYAGENGKVEFDAIPDATKETTENGVTTKVESYLVTITPNTGYQTQDGLSLTYRDDSGAAQTLALQTRHAWQSGYCGRRSPAPCCSPGCPSTGR